MLRFGSLLLIGALCGCQHPQAADDVAPATTSTQASSVGKAEPGPLRGSTGDVVAVVFTSVDCPVANAMAPQLSRVYEEAEGQGVRCYLVYPRTGTTDDAMVEHTRAYGLPGTRIADSDHVLVETLDAQITPQAYVLAFTGPDQWQVRYRGRINDLYPSIGSRRVEPTRNELHDAIQATISNRPVTTSRTEAVGCMIQRRN